VLLTTDFGPNVFSLNLHSSRLCNSSKVYPYNYDPFIEIFRPLDVINGISLFKSRRLPGLNLFIKPGIEEINV
jgi:hypothetical protein